MPEHPQLTCYALSVCFDTSSQQVPPGAGLVVAPPKPPPTQAWQRRQQIPAGELYPLPDMDGRLLDGATDGPSTPDIAAEQPGTSGQEGAARAGGGASGAGGEDMVMAEGGDSPPGRPLIGSPDGGPQSGSIGGANRRRLVVVLVNHTCSVSTLRGYF